MTAQVWIEAYGRAWRKRDAAAAELPSERWSL